jgi:Cu+-exporting ATPase
MDHRKSQLDVQGMSCANCSGTVGDALEALDGVEEANVNFATDEGSVTYDPEGTSLAAIYEAIENSGYSAVRSSASISITDMTCSNCAETNEDALEGVPGVIAAEVNYATDEADVEYNPTETSREQLYNAIESAGYSPVHENDSDGSERDQRDAARNGEIERQRRLTVFGAVLSAPLVFFLAEKFLLGGGVLPETLFGVEFGRIEFLLATPVYLVLGKDFFENSYKALIRNRTANMDVLIALGSSTAYLYSVVVLLGVLAGGLYFDTAALILVFITLGNYLEARSKGQAGEALQELLEMEADTATVVDAEGNEEEVPLEDVAVGDRMKVRPHQ